MAGQSAGGCFTFFRKEVMYMEYLVTLLAILIVIYLLKDHKNDRLG